jgi:hypothetical protein
MVKNAQELRRGIDRDSLPVVRERFETRVGSWWFANLRALLIGGSLIFQIRLEADSIQSWLDFCMGHKRFPNETRPVILNHHDNGSLIKSHVNVFEPVFWKTEAVAKAVNPP